VTLESIQKNGGGKLLLPYKNSPSVALQSIYPQHSWIVWKFTKPAGYWKDTQTHIQFFDWSGARHGYKNKEDWYNVTKEDINEYGGGLLPNYYSSSPLKALNMIG